MKACEGEGERISLSYCIIVLSPWLYLVFLVRGLSVPTVVHVYTGHKCLCSHTPPTSALSTQYFKKYFIGKSFIFHDYMKHDPDLPALIYFDFVNNEEQ